MPLIVTCIAPVNIAVIKYWGKRDEDLILPLNDSVSLTLCTEQMHSKTTVMISSEFTRDQIWLNGQKESVANPRLATCLTELRRRAREEESKAGESRSDWKIHICSENNFPTAAGLASSAAGYACLVFALAKLLGLEGEVSGIARLGSGSACRSLYGGFVRWKAGCAKDGSDSIAEQLAPSSHWPSLRILVLVVNDSRKKTSSSEGMRRSVRTSQLLDYRVKHCVPERSTLILQAIKEKDFASFADVTMKDSNQFHSVCLDTFPPAVYMNDVSHAIVEFVHAYNKSKGTTRLCYTFDAGPNACLIMEQEDVNEVVSVICETFPPSDDSHRQNYVRGIPFDSSPTRKDSGLKMGPVEAGLLRYMILTKVGEGPELLKNEAEHLLDSDTGLPKRLKTLA